MRKTKIICTLGPANDDEQVLKKLMLEGMNAARFNFSHADHASHKKKLDMVVRLREELKLPIATILDTKGPEIRIGTFKEGKIQLKKGDYFTLTTNEVEGTEKMVSISYKDLPKDIKAGATVLIDDGLIEMTVASVTDTDIVCTVRNDGVVSNNKGINVPGTRLSMPFISERDRSDIIFGIENGFDYIAASFTRSADDILEVRKLLEEYDCHDINIIAKIENAEGVDNIDEIIRVVDGIMVARGDMGVEIPLEEVPVLQKLIIQKAYNAGKQVVTGYPDARFHDQESAPNPCGIHRRSQRNLRRHQRHHCCRARQRQACIRSKLCRPWSKLPNEPNRTSTTSSASTRAARLAAWTLPTPSLTQPVPLRMIWAQRPS